MAGVTCCHPRQQVLRALALTRLNQVLSARAAVT